MRKYGFLKYRKILINKNSSLSGLTITQVTFTNSDKTNKTMKKQNEAELKLYLTEQSNNFPHPTNEAESLLRTSREAHSGRPQDWDVSRACQNECLTHDLPAGLGTEKKLYAYRRLTYINIMCKCLIHINTQFLNPDAIYYLKRIHKSVC